jgi:hypothetical protein
MCAAAQTTAVRQFPSTLLAPNRPSAISPGHQMPDSAGRNADTTRLPTGSCCRLCTFVLAQASSAT